MILLTNRSTPLMRLFTRIIALCTLALSSSCGDGACVIPPCAPPVAVTFVVTSAASGAPIQNAMLHQTGTSNSDSPCTPNACVVFGEGGTYEIDIVAAGFQTAHRSVTVSSHQAHGCGCEIVDTQHISIALSPATPSQR